MPLPHQPVGGQTALEIAAIQAREALLARNTYNNDGNANNYSATHTRALSDQITPINGKGTGSYLDIENYNAGAEYDKNGNAIYVGSGRKPALANNGATWGYNPDSVYEEPDTSKNIGQVIIP